MQLGAGIAVWRCRKQRLTNQNRAWWDRVKYGGPAEKHDRPSEK
jgi:hypothetical protein